MAKIQTTEAYFNPFGRFIYYNTRDHKHCVLLNEKELTAQRKKCKK